MKIELKKFDAICVDLNGVIQDPQTGAIYPQLREYIDKANSLDIPIIVVSNSTQSEDIFSKKVDMFDIRYSKVFTAGMSFVELIKDKAQELIKKPIIHNKIYGIGHTFDAVLAQTQYSFTKNIDEADFAYLGIPQISKEEYLSLSDELKKGFCASEIVAGNFDVLSASNEAMQYFYEKYIKNINLPIFNANQDKICLENVSYSKEAMSLYRQGQFAMIAKQNGKEVIESGKPDLLIYNNISKIIADITGAKKANVLFLGDNFQTDVLGFVNAMEAGVFGEESRHIACINDYYINIDSNVTASYKVLAKILNNIDILPWFSDKVCCQTQEATLKKATEMFEKIFTSK